MSVIRIRKRTFYTTIAAAVVAAIVVVACCFRHVIIGWLMPVPDRVEQECLSYNVLRADGSDVLIFRHISGDSLFLSSGSKQLSGGSKQLLDDSKYFYSAGNGIGGHAVAADTLWQSDALHKVVERTIDDCQRKLDAYDAMERECEYFLSRNGIQDEGYSTVEQYAANIDSLRQRGEKVLKALRSITPKACLTVAHITRATTNGTSLSPVFMESMGGVWRGGRWYKAPRKGRGVGKDSLNRWISGVWAADTVSEGSRVDSLGIYRGQFSRSLAASGHGTLHSSDGVYYQGQFAGDRQHGFCISLDSHRLRIGEWAEGRYRGQRLNFTTERIYGIDISRYQHGKGRKYYPIQWKNLRVRSLGTLSKKRVTGAVDYPVSFVYIKSTEGVSVRNRYYLADYRAARKYGYRCGAYHFFSTKTSGAAQARHFLRYSRFQRGDLPPVLDVEPTGRQIAQMGGAGAMFASIRSWINIVRKRTGVRPVLYVSQTFVNRYLPQAPDLMHGYNIWIARYGEFKPDVHLVFWQLCPDGRVSGITGEVDVNVFNGYSSQWKKFLENECVK